MKKYFFVCMICCSLFFCGCSNRSYLEEQNSLELESGESFNQDFESMAAETIFVQVAGAVKNPGVFELPTDARVFQAIFCAGGFLDTADEGCINQAARLSDGQRLYVYTKEEFEKESEKQDGSGLININKATEAELMTLPGIGQSKAAQIVAYRNANGMFSSKEDIMKIQGIKEGVYSKISDLIVAN